MGEPVPNAIHVGVMLEVPSLFFQMSQLLGHVDFISIGSNDLFQFLFAMDRGNARISGRYDLLSPLVLNFLRDIARRCDEAGVALGLCGEMAAKPLEAMALIGCGFRVLSVAPPAVGPVKNHGVVAGHQAADATHRSCLRSGEDRSGPRISPRVRPRSWDIRLIA